MFVPYAAICHAIAQGSSSFALFYGFRSRGETTHFDRRQKQSAASVKLQHHEVHASISEAALRRHGKVGVARHAAKPPIGPPSPQTLRWYWTLYKQSDHSGTAISVSISKACQIRRACSALGWSTVRSLKTVRSRRRPEPSNNQGGNEGAQPALALRGMIRRMIDKAILTRTTIQPSG
jgi:hypothetical protein